MSPHLRHCVFSVHTVGRKPYVGRPCGVLPC